jgi:hypothetical protein
MKNVSGLGTIVKKICTENVDVDWVNAQRKSIYIHCSGRVRIQKGCCSA